MSIIISTCTNPHISQIMRTNIHIYSILILFMMINMCSSYTIKTFQSRIISKTIYHHCSILQYRYHIQYFGTFRKASASDSFNDKYSYSHNTAPSGRLPYQLREHKPVIDKRTPTGTSSFDNNRRSSTTSNNHRDNEFEDNDQNETYEARDTSTLSSNNYQRTYNNNRPYNNNNDFKPDYRRYTREKQSKRDDDGYDGDYVYGIAPVRMALKSYDRKLYTLLVQEGMDVSNKKDDKAAQDILDIANDRQIQQQEMSKHDMNMLTDSRPHQGFILKASKKSFEPLKSLPMELEFKCVLALDEVWDPQNFGALVRTCHFLKIDKIVVCAKNSAPPSPVVSKASAGALEVTTIHSVQNMMKFIDESVKNGWQVVGTSLSGNTISLSELPLDKPTIVVLGNEGHGIRTNILNRCTNLVRIGSSSSGGAISDVDSLNVSVTGGIILHHVMQNK